MFSECLHQAVSESSRLVVPLPALDGWCLLFPPSCVVLCPYPGTWRPACRSARCPGTRHTWWPSCWAPRWSDGGCCGAFAPSGAGCTLQGTQLISRVTTKSLQRWHWQREENKLSRSLPSGVEDSFLRLEGGASRLMGVGWCSGERTMADMMICCLAVAGVEGWGWSDIFRWAATDKTNVPG